MCVYRVLCVRLGENYDSGNDNADYEVRKHEAFRIGFSASEHGAWKHARRTSDSCRMQFTSGGSKSAFIQVIFLQVKIYVLQCLLNFFMSETLQYFQSGATTNRIVFTGLLIILAGILVSGKKMVSLSSFATASSTQGSKGAAVATSVMGKRLETMIQAEAALLEFAQRFGSSTPPVAAMAKLTLFDTPIARRALTSLKPGCTWTLSGKQEPEFLTLHGVKVLPTTPAESHHVDSPPLVLLHGYANGALYYYRNLVDLAQHFRQGVYSLDLLGWGLSSRPKFTLIDTSVESAESFFVDSLEEWRKHHNIDKMILAGHSMGGYISVAYTEKYPQHVERLILLSPVGVPHSQDEEETRKARGMAPSNTVSWTWKLARTFFTSLWEWEITPGALLRTMSESRGRKMVASYVANRLPAVDAHDEQLALGEYLYTNALLPPSGEFCLNRILKPVAYARKPTVERVPLLKVGHVTFVYGQHDWMDISGGLDVQQRCDQKGQSIKDSGLAEEISKQCQPPKVDVHVVKKAGHLLMLENWQEFNSSVIVAGLGYDYYRRHCTLPQPDFVSYQDKEELMRQRSTTTGIHKQEDQGPPARQVSSVSSSGSQ